MSILNGALVLQLSTMPTRLGLLVLLLDVAIPRLLLLPVSAQQPHAVIAAATTPVAQARLLLSVMEPLPLSSQRNNWQPGSDFCKWDGITCDPTTRLITALDTDFSKQLQARQVPCFKDNKLPAALAGLTSLQVLKLVSWACLPPPPPPSKDDNQNWDQYYSEFQGTLPPEWSMLRNLRVLTIQQTSNTQRVGSTSLAGPLPVSWGQLDRLQVLELYQVLRVNQPLPAEWAGMRSLQNLTLWSLNDGLGGLPGALPAAWGSLANLKFLKLFMLGFKAPPELPEAWAGMRSIQSMDLFVMNITGTLPSSWGPKLTNLKLLRVSGSRPDMARHLTGQLPASWSGLKGLEELELSSHLLSGTLPPAWAELAALKSLDLSRNELAGYLPAQWGRLAALQTLSLQENKGIKGPFPAAWGSLGSMATPAVVVAQQQGYGDAQSVLGCNVMPYELLADAKAMSKARLLLNFIGLTGISGCVPKQLRGRVLFRESVDDYEGGFPCGFEPSSAAAGPLSGPQFSGWCP